MAKFSEISKIDECICLKFRMISLKYILENLKSKDWQPITLLAKIHFLRQKTEFEFFFCHTHMLELCDFFFKSIFWVLLYYLYSITV